MSFVQKTKDEKIECDFNFILKEKKFMIISILTAPRPTKNNHLTTTTNSILKEISKFSLKIQKKVKKKKI